MACRIVSFECIELVYGSVWRRGMCDIVWARDISVISMYSM